MQKEKIIIQGLKYLEEIRKKKKRFSQEVFESYCSAVITCPVEIIAYTKTGKIFMNLRSNDDKFFANLWHTTGTLQLPNETESEATKRLLKGELGKLKILGKPEFVGVVEILKGNLKQNKNPRSQERSVVYVLEVSETNGFNDEINKFFPINNLPRNTLSFHKNILIPKVQKYLKDNDLVNVLKAVKI